MPAFAAIALTDRQPTPATHTFVPFDQANGVAELRVPGTSPIADKKLTISRRLSANRYRVKTVLSVPIVQTEVINGISRPVVVRTGYGEFTFTFADSATEQERNDLEGMLADSLGVAKTLIHGVVVGNQGIY